MLSDRVFQSILPLNDRELCPYERVFTFGYTVLSFSYILLSRLGAWVGEGREKERNHADRSFTVDK